MRHNKKFNHLSRTSSHRKAMLANMASSLILHKRITTTVAKAKALQMYIEPLITKSKAANNATISTIVKTVEMKYKDGNTATVERTINVNSSTPARRLVFSYLKDKEAVKELFGVVAAKVGDRPGGYTRVLKTGFRKGDAAEMALIELVDFNESAMQTTAKKETKKTTRRSRKKVSGDKPAAEQPKVLLTEQSDPIEDVQTEQVTEQTTVAETETAQTEETAESEVATVEPANEVEKQENI
ncbi:MAG: 50S ribosomal protein L17 [Prevotellaceae bacterium]|jgi:large subunit ribosomal protein L17|nr:50S ribosomal protein L17 [Prevotellaceae bacterium]